MSEDINKLKRGTISVSITLAMTVGIVVIGWVATFYTVTGAVDKRVTITETQIPFILDSQKGMAKDIGEIKSILMRK